MEILDSHSFAQTNPNQTSERDPPFSLNQFAQSDINTFARTHYTSSQCDDPVGFISENTRKIAESYANSIYN